MRRGRFGPPRSEARGAPGFGARLAEYRFRTRGLGLAVGVMGVLGILLYLKIREIDRRAK